MAVTEAGREELFGRMTTRDMGLTVDETIGGLALIVLGVLALAGINPPLLLSIATIVAGAALLFMSLTLASEFGKALAVTSREAAEHEVWSAGILAGVVGIVLGTLALLDVGGATLLSVALIVFGAAVFLDFIMMSQARALKMTPITPASEPSRIVTPTGEPARLAFSTAASSDMASVLFGFALVLLGIVALTGLNSEVLIAVGLLGLGGYAFLKGTAAVTHMFSRKTLWSNG